MLELIHYVGAENPPLGYVPREKSEETSFRKQKDCSCERGMDIFEKLGRTCPF